MTNVMYNDAVIDYVDDPALADDVFTTGGGSGLGRLEKILAQRELSGVLTESELTTIGMEVVRDWQQDRDENKDWRNQVQKALDAASQEPAEPKTFPWKGAANVKYPLLSIATQQFSARAYPALVKGDEAILVKTFGADPQGMKKARAKRVADYLNFVLFYKVEDWEGDTDSLLNQLPSTGTCFRKVYYDALEQKYCIRLVPALRLTVPIGAKTLETSPRITEDFDQFPNDIARMKKARLYRDVVLVDAAQDEQASRVILEQHRMMDLDEDGIDEPYIVTVDEQTSQVLRLERAYDKQDIELNGEDVLAIKRWQPYVKYAFLRDPKGRFYEIGFGHLLGPIMEVVNSIINQSLDAGAAQAAGGGFIAAELRLQGAGQNGRLLFEPGKYKTTNTPGAALRDAIYERTFPGPSDVLFKLLGMIMEAAKDVASVNDAITGDAARSAPVGTTLALIEQGQQVFNAIFKRFYRGARTEYQKFAECVRRYGDPQDYVEFLDDEAANFDADFEEAGMDIRPVADPSAVTQQQRIAKSQMILSLAGTGQVNPQVATKQALEAINADDIEGLMTMPKAEPPPGVLEEMAMKLAKAEAEVELLKAKSGTENAKAQQILTDAARTGMEAESGQVQADVAATQAAAEKDRADAFVKAAGLFGQAAGQGAGE
jgi:chaperonin GroES